jgi:hypothetical protein
MAANIYDLNSPYVPAAAPTAPAPAPAAAATRFNSDRLLRGSVYLLLLAGAFLLAAFLLAASPLARWDVDLTVPFLAALVGGIGAVGWAVAR